MNKDVECWINHITSKNITNKRKRGVDTDILVNELICVSIENLINCFKENGIKENSITDRQFILCIKKILINAKELLLYDILKTTKTNKNEQSSMILLIKASISITIDILDQMSEKKNNFNAIKWLNNYKSKYNIPIKNRKLTSFNLAINDDFINDETEEIDDSEVETTDDEDDQDEDYFPDPKEYKGTSTIVSNFIAQLKLIANGTVNSKEEIVNYFNTVEQSDKDEYIEILNKLNSSVTCMPSLFRILTLDLSDSTKKNLISKMLNASNGLTENGKLRKWLDDAMKIPFGVYKGLDINNIVNKPNKVKKFLNRLKDTMDSAVWGHDDAKKKIIEIMAQQIRNPDCKGNVIGLWGGPGTGKSSIIKDGIAKAMNKPFVFISLGGATDSSYLDGHSFTYEGSIYGRIAQAIIDSKCMNPIIYFDELDKVSETAKGEEIINLLIHLIDPVQNQLFRDKYFYEIDIDLSKVTFIFSLNDPSNVNYILKDRITMIETKSLTLDQKLHIGTHYLMKDIMKDFDINNNDIIIPPDIMTNIINQYTNEGGVRSLKKHLYNIVRELNVANLCNSMIGSNIIKFPIKFTQELYDCHYYGKSPINHMTVHKTDGVGMVNGLWANSLGMGGVLPIETVLIPTNEMMSVKATGSLGNVIKESIDVALSVAWSWLDRPTKTKWMTKWKRRPECFHVHCPDGSTEKEGPSAGAAMSLAFYSRLTDRMICSTVAMTGEINLRGEVTEIGGLEEKLCAAKKAGAKLVLVPKENEKDLIKITKRYPSLINDKNPSFQIKIIETFDDVIKYGLL
jgi:ATP-dependent Lon protease